MDLIVENTTDHSSYHLLGFFRIDFEDSLRVYMSYCSSVTKFTTEPPAVISKTWTIWKTFETIIVKCNEVEVMRFVFPAGSCKEQWGGDSVSDIHFGLHDNSSLQYRPGEIIPGKNGLILSFHLLVVL